MRHLKIKNVGPLKDVDLELKRINVIIGPQSSGKSCILKIACHCAWIEKQIELEQSAKRFIVGDTFATQLELSHNMKGYFGENSLIQYKTDFMSFSYSGKSKKFNFKWGKSRWDYKRTKICYIPAERNIVALLPEHQEIFFGNNNTQSFCQDWKKIRSLIDDFEVLNLGVKYHYNSNKDCDEVLVNDSLKLQARYVSSGIQSLIPLCGLLQYFFEKQFYIKGEEILDLNPENIKILQNIYTISFKRAAILSLEAKKTDKSIDKFPYIRNIAGHSLMFKNKADADKCERQYINFSKVDHSDIFLEEPELNLFPTTQYDLLNWLIEKSSGKREHSIFIATHSPYILTSLNILLAAVRFSLEKKEKFDEVEKIVPKKRMLRVEEVGAYSIDDGKIISMIDTDNKLILAEKLDHASDIIDKEFNKLLWL